MSHPHEHDVYISNTKCSYIFSVDEIIEFAEKYSISEVNIDHLDSELYDYSHSYLDVDTQKRIDNADLSYPVILVSNKKQKIIAVLDGTHRIRKAIQLRYKTIQAIIIPKKDMEQFNSSKILGQIIVNCSKLRQKELKLLKSLILKPNDWFIENYLENK